MTVLAVDGANAFHNDEVIAGQGGLFTTTAPWIQSQITDKWITPSSHGVWHHFHHSNYGDIGLINVYAPNESCDRAQLWE